MALTEANIELSSLVTLTTTPAMATLPGNTTKVPNVDLKQPFLLITQETYTQNNFITSIILTPIISVLGILGNSVGLRVLGKDPNKRQMTIYTYLLSLMAFDIVYLILGLSVTATEGSSLFDKYLGNEIIENFGIYRGYIDIVLNHISTALLIYMSLERLLALICPFKVKNSCLSKYPRVIIFATVVGSAVSLLPFVLSIRVVCFTNEENRTAYTTALVPEYVDLFENFIFVQNILLHFLCPIAILVLNLGIAISYSRFKKQRSSALKTSQSDDRKITIVVLSVATMYFVLSLPNLFIKTVMFLDSDYSFYGRFRIAFFFFINIGDLLARINAATDFLIYILVCGHYRALVMSMICKCPRLNFVRNKRTEYKPEEEEKDGKKI